MALRNALVLLLTVSILACDQAQAPTAPTPIVPTVPATPARSDLTIHTVLAYPTSPVHGVGGVRVTCLSCEDGQTAVTDDDGRAVFTDVLPTITVRIEKAGYVGAEAEVYNGQTIRLGHEWPGESAGSFRRLILPPSLQLVWGEQGWELFPGRDDVGGIYYGTGKVVVVGYDPDRRVMLKTMEHELRHAHQHQIDLPGGNATTSWERTEEGRKWLVATAEDLKRPPQLWMDFSYASQSWEAEAEFYAWWVRAETRDPDRDRFCTIAPTRCRYFAELYGPRPESYP